MQLRRSHQYKQVQISFDQQPDEKYLAMLREAGWTDRTESEGIWTKQVGQGQWQPVADAERLFKEIANAIRRDKGLCPCSRDPRWRKSQRPSSRTDSAKSVVRKDTGLPTLVVPQSNTFSCRRFHVSTGGIDTLVN